VDDLVLLDDISEKGVVKNLENRYEKDLIYTYIGDVLVSVNPFKNVPGLYKRELMQRYFGRQKFELAPHVFGSAEDAFRKLMTTGKDQCVLISGESGAGKTEAAKKLLEYVTVASQDRAEVNEDLSVGDIKDALLQSNPVLEAFGNAQTLRNDNSSRFGKYLEVFMNYNGTPLGGSITSYLLEKPRVVGQTEGERNFHVFYQLLSGDADPELGLGRAEDYNYTKTSTKVRGIDDRHDFQEMCKAMRHVGVSKEDQKNIFRLVAAVLHIGNINFKAKSGGESCSVSSSSSKEVEKAAKLLHVRPKDLQRAITHRTISSRTESITSPLTSVDECIKTRDALSKALYSRNFLHLIDLINIAIHTDMRELTLGVLDIYGFEIFKTNSFEQLCINYCNEKLQQLFIELTLKAEQDEYAREGIRWEKISFFNNKIVCDLIEARKPAGIFAYMDEECIYPKGSDSSLLKKMESNLRSHKHYGSLVTKTSHDASEFMIKHYAGDVVYSVDNMLDKNKDTLFPDLKRLMQSSKSKFFSKLMPESHDGKKPITAGTAFVRDMQALITDLEKCEPHYIRTVKPNDKKRGGMYDRELVTHQVRYLGMVENVRVRRAGFAFRSDYDYFFKHYKMLNDSTWPRGSGNSKRDTDTILRGLGISDFENGKTKVFIREPKSVFKLEEAREKAVDKVVRIIQRSYRAYKARLYFLRLREESAMLLHQKKRRRNSWVLYFIGDYIRAQENDMIATQIDGRVKFADQVSMLDSKKKMVAQILVITSRNVFLFQPGTYKLTAQISFEALESFGMSTFADGFMIIEYIPDKSAPTVVIESMRKAEIVTVLKEEYGSMKGGLNIQFQDSYEINVMKTLFANFRKKIVPKTLVFQENGALNGALTQIVTSKADLGPEFKTMMRVDVSANLGSNAPYQLDSPLPDRLRRFKGKPTGMKKIVYGGYRQHGAQPSSSRRRSKHRR